MLNTKMRAVMDDVSGNLAERDELVRLIAIALLTRKNVFILGDTGQAKSYAINQFRQRIRGARQFERLLSKQCDEEQLFGRIDLGSLVPGSVAKKILDNDPSYCAVVERLKSLYSQYASGDFTVLDAMKAEAAKGEALRLSLSIIHGNEPQIITDAKIPDSHIIFLDEIFKANDGILNALLTALNERRFTNEGYTTDIPAISFFSASNEIPNFNDPAEKILRPLVSYKNVTRA